MTTLRRVLLQSAKEAGPSDVATTSAKAVTPHNAKSTPRRSSPALSASDNESLDEDAQDKRKTNVTKRRRTSKGWDEASKEAEIRSPKSTVKEGEERTKSPRLIGRSSSSSSTTNPLLKSPKSLLLPPSMITSTNVEKREPSVEKTPSPLTEVTISEVSSPPVDDVKEEVKMVEDVANVNAIPDIRVETANVDQVDQVEKAPKPSRSPSPPKPSSSPPSVAPLKDAAKERQSSVPSTISSTSSQTRPSTGRPPNGDRTVSHAVIAQEWVQCEDCKKWRKLPLNIPASSLPDSWFCHMNTWNAALASCTASVEEGSEETTEDAHVGNADVNGATVGLANGPKRTAVLPPGINLYGGQVQPVLTPAGPYGARQRPSTYRDLIGAHYRTNKAFISSFGATCDARYAAFPAYVSPTLKPRVFDSSSALLAFPKMGWCTNGSNAPSQNGGNHHEMEVVTEAQNGDDDSLLPTKLMIKRMAWRA